MQLTSGKDLIKQLENELKDEPTNYKMFKEKTGLDLEKLDTETLGLGIMSIKAILQDRNIVITVVQRIK